MEPLLQLLIEATTIVRIAATLAAAVGAVIAVRRWRSTAHTADGVNGIAAALFSVGVIGGVVAPAVMHN